MDGCGNIEANLKLETRNLKLPSIPNHAPVAQLDRVPDYESGGRTFESCRVHQYLPQKYVQLFA
jgi:hypothetical protein